MKLKAILVLLAALIAVGRCHAAWPVQEIDSEGLSGQYVSLQVDSRGYPHISYCEGDNGDLKYARWNGVCWDIETVDPEGITGAYTSLALDAADRPHITYFDNTNHRLKYARWTGGDWDFQVVDPVCPNIGCTSLALDGQGRPRVAYFINNGLVKGGYRVKYAEWTGTSWSTSTVDTETNPARDNDTEVALALDADGQPHLAYYSWENAVGPERNWTKIKYARRQGRTWKRSKIAWGQLSTHSLAIDGKGRPHIVFGVYGTGFNTLRYARWTGDAWDITTMAWDPAIVSGWIGGPYSMALDAEDNPHVICVDNRKCLFHEYWNGSSWRTEKIDERDAVGNYNALAIDAQGKLHAAYYDNASGALRYAAQGVPAASVNSPTLGWTGEREFTDKGVAPDSGGEGTGFTFRIRYADADNDAPRQGCPKLYVQNRGREIGGSPFVMQETDPRDITYSDGKIYARTLRLPAGVYTYRMEAVDAAGAMADSPVGALHVSGPATSPKEGAAQR